VLFVVSSRNGKTMSDQFLPDHGYIVWIPAGHSFFTFPTPKIVEVIVEVDEEPPSGASSD